MYTGLLLYDSYVMHYVEQESTESIAGWVNWHAIAMLVAVAAVYGLGTTLPITLAALFSFAHLLLRRMRKTAARRLRHRYAHQLTLIRLLILGYAAWQIENIEQSWMLILLASNVVLDVIDGMVARRFTQASNFGTTFDREVDGFFVLVACVYFDLAGGIGSWILVQGLLPYIYRLINWQVGTAADTGNKQRHAAFLAGLNFVLLVTAVAVTPDQRVVLLVISTAIVTLSFLISFWMLFSRRDGNTVL